MASESEIRLNYEESLRKAREMEDIASELRQNANGELDQALAQLSQGWKGEGADAYMQKGAALREKILESAKDLEHTAEAVKTMAKRLYDAEMAAYRLAQMRTYTD